MAVYARNLRGCFSATVLIFVTCDTRSQYVIIYYGLCCNFIPKSDASM